MNDASLIIRQAATNDATAIAKHEMIRRLGEVLQRAGEVLQTASVQPLLAIRRIQAFENTGLSAIFDCVSQLKGHVEVIIFPTRIQLGDRYHFDWVPSMPEQEVP